MKKILIDKNEEIAEIVEKILGEPERDITLVVPRHADLMNSVSNFHLLKREAEMGGKRVSVESVDENVLAIAKSSGIDVAHPLLDNEHRGQSLSDIVAAKGEASPAHPIKVKSGKVGKKH